MQMPITDCKRPLTSTWPHLRCDVGLEEGEYWKKNSCVTVLCTTMLHKNMSSSYRSVDCIGLWSCLVWLCLQSACVFGLHCAIKFFFCLHPSLYLLVSWAW